MKLYNNYINLTICLFVWVSMHVVLGEERGGNTQQLINPLDIDVMMSSIFCLPKQRAAVILLNHYHHWLFECLCECLCMQYWRKGRELSQQLITPLNLVWWLSALTHNRPVIISVMYVKLFNHLLCVYACSVWEKGGN